MTAFLITIDTEGDNLWACPREITTYNSHYLPRFQQLCERYASSRHGSRIGRWLSARSIVSSRAIACGG